jgi:hypothetical protein
MWTNSKQEKIKIWKIINPVSVNLLCIKLPYPKSQQLKIITILFVLSICDLRQNSKENLSQPQMIWLGSAGATRSKIPQPHAWAWCELQVRML